MSISIYQLKPQFQALLRPAVNKLAAIGVSANQVTLTACLVSVLIGVGLYWHGSPSSLFLIIPLWMFLRMALNAIDGMLAREHSQQSKLGAILNELTDVVSDAALLLPFAAVIHIEPVLIALIVVLSGLSEFSGVLGLTIGASRRYDGPMGKSDRAFVFGAIGLYLGVFGRAPPMINWLLGIVALLICWSVLNRMRRALGEIKGDQGA